MKSLRQAAKVEHGKSQCGKAFECFGICNNTTKYFSVHAASTYALNEEFYVCKEKGSEKMWKNEHVFSGDIFLESCERSRSKRSSFLLPSAFTWKSLKLELFFLFLISRKEFAPTMKFPTFVHGQRHANIQQTLIDIDEKFKIREKLLSNVILMKGRRVKKLEEIQNQWQV